MKIFLAGGCRATSNHYGEIFVKIYLAGFTGRKHLLQMSVGGGGFPDIKDYENFWLGSYHGEVRGGMTR